MNLLSSERLQDSELVNIYALLSSELEGSESELAAEYARKGIAIAGQTGDTENLAYFYFRLAATYYYRSIYDSALACYDEVMRLVPDESRSARQDSLLIEALIDYGNVHNIRGNSPEALDYYFKALRKAEEMNMNKPVIDIYANIGQIYFSMNNFERCEEYFVRMRDLCNKLNDSLALAYALDGLCEVHAHRAEWDKALECADLANRIVSVHPEAKPSERMTGLLSLAMVWYDGFHDFDKALGYAVQALDYAEKCQQPLYVAHAQYQISSIYMGMKNYAAAEKAAREAFQADSSSAYVNTALHENITKANIMLGNRAAAMEYFERYKKWMNDYSNQNFQISLSEVEVKYESSKKDMEIISQSAKIAQSETERFVLTVVLAFLVIILALLSYILWLRIRRNRTLSEINATKDKFFNILSHDLRSPAIALRNGLKTLSGNVNVLNGNDIKEFASELLLTSDSQIELLESILNWARLQAGRMEYKPVKLDVATALRTELNIARTAATNKGVSLTTNIPADLSVTADPEMLRTVVRNLLNNAIKFTASGGNVSLNIQHTANRRCSFTVADNGTGMNDEQLKNIFRVDKRTSLLGTNGEQGTGLGLVVCKELVEKHGSKLTVTSVPAKGTQFRFDIAD
jgi:signal transduction histidine kinase